MKAVVLAAGFGTRLRPLTDRLPKPLIPILGQPLLRHIIMKLAKSKVTDIGINIHHNAHMIHGFLEMAQPAGVGIEISHEQQIMGVAGGIAGFRTFLQDEDFFILHNGDVLSAVSLEALIATYTQEPALFTMVVHDHPDFNTVSIDTNGHIIDIRDELNARGVARKLAYTGIACVDTAFLDFIPEGPADLIPILLDLIIRGHHSIRAVIVDDCCWRDIGTIASYYETHKEILLMKNPLVEENLIPQGPVFFGDGTQVAEDVELQGFISAGNNCIVPRGCILENCIIWDNVAIEEKASFKDAIIGNGWVVHATK